MGDCLPPSPTTVLQRVWVLMMTTKKSSLRVKPGDPPSSHMEKFLRPLSAKSCAKSPLPLGGLLSHPAARFPYWVTLKFIIPALVNGCVQLFRANIAGNGQECNMLWGQRYFSYCKTILFTYLPFHFFENFICEDYVYITSTPPSPPLTPSASLLLFLKCVTSLAHLVLLICT